MPYQDDRPYMDAAESVGARIADLLPRMTVADKIGLMFHPVVQAGSDATATAASDPYTGTSATELISARRITHFLPQSSLPTREMAQWHNDLQRLAQDTELAIPLSLSSDPRHSFVENALVAGSGTQWSMWPEPPGLAAIGSEQLVREYADTVRQEYLAVGLRVALHPVADLATEPRWPRVQETFGEDAGLAGRLVAAYVQGLLGPGGSLGTDSVSAMVKHFPGAGPQKDGEDAHFPTGREQIYPGGNFEYHLQPFRAALAAGASQVMPYYAMPIGLYAEEVGFGFNRDVITGVLRDRLGFTGIVCTDWSLVTDVPTPGGVFEARAWGVEDLTREQRMHKALAAGVDQFGGECSTDVLHDLVRTGYVEESSLDASVARLLAEKFRLGLFDDRRYVDPDEAERIVGREEFTAAGAHAQARAVTVLTNADQVLPLGADGRLHVQGMDNRVVGRYSPLARNVDGSDVALVRLAAPFDPRGGHQSGFHHGRLSYTDDELRPVIALADARPTVVVIDMDRPAVLPELAARAAAVVAVFGASDDAVMQALTGRVPPEGRLPFRLARSTASIAAGAPDLADKGETPLFAFGDGLRLDSTT